MALDDFASAPFYIKIVKNCVAPCLIIANARLFQIDIWQDFYRNFNVDFYVNRLPLGFNRHTFLPVNFYCLIYSDYVSECFLTAL